MFFRAIRVTFGGSIGCITKQRGLMIRVIRVIMAISEAVSDWPMKIPIGNVGQSDFIRCDC